MFTFCLLRAELKVTVGEQSKQSFGNTTVVISAVTLHDASCFMWMTHLTELALRPECSSPKQKAYVEQALLRK